MMTIKKKPTGGYGSPGWRRMQAHLGAGRLEEMRFKTLREQEEALARASGEKVADPATDRETYRGYPAPRQHKPKGKKS